MAIESNACHLLVCLLGLPLAGNALGADKKADKAYPCPTLVVPAPQVKQKPQATDMALPITPAPPATGAKP